MKQRENIKEGGMKRITNKMIAERAMTQGELKDIIDDGMRYEDIWRDIREEMGDHRRGQVDGITFFVISNDRCDKISDLIAQANGYEDAYDCVEDLMKKGIITK
jgi:hypothetical protein